MVKKLTHSDGDVKRYMGSLKEYFSNGIKAIGEQYFDLKRDIQRIDKKLDSHTEMIGQILVRLEEVKGELKQKVNYQDFAKLERRVAHLEARGGGRH